MFTVVELMQEIKMQRITIDSLQRKIDFLVARVGSMCGFLGLSECETNSQLSSLKSGYQDSTVADSLVSAGGSHNPEARPTDGDGTSSDVNAPPVRDGDVEEGRGGGRDRNRATINDAKTLTDIVLDAFYKDSSDRARRARTVIMYGVAESGEDEDTSYILQLFHTEFDYVPESLTCRRLGKNLTDQSRPLLVTLPAAEEASWLVANGRRLRKSRDSWVSKNIYINKNLSKIEQREAYEGRCRRRTTAGQAASQPIRVVINSHMRSDLNRRTYNRDGTGLQANVNNLSEFPELNCENRTTIASGAVGGHRPAFTRPAELSDSANGQSASYSSVRSVAAQYFAVSPPQAAESASEDVNFSDVLGISKTSNTTVSTMWHAAGLSGSDTVKTRPDVSAPGCSQLQPPPGALSAPSSTSLPSTMTTTA